tara:strand:- start:113427 stop:113873 length:447 start_codon:yes stop_codon:yes gene_type:complete
MRIIILLTLLLVSFTTSAAEMPKYLEGATVTVTLKNGKTYSYKSEDMAVVPRLGLGSGMIYKKHFELVHNKLKRREIVKNKRHRFYGLLGIGTTGDLQSRTDGSEYTIEQDEGNVYGLGYQYKLTNTLNIGLLLQDNKTTSFSLGADF